ncbi:methyl-accepting chemotaxis protein [Vibrio nigripulchritudo]|uniref:methyl-accepting chemotaxis protein n=1 Tax=Vibrio nigripulchritudo TaxID=28173 RepID=UPI00248F6BD8|nr:methyl-accepting chemotaxis protein [Vibrio nigripulchritudo]BDU40492.1 methyl-accepting chemotaxis protein [Vibrio nigripulchritudo]BDU46229.1 methyl-accepting chemotaxis protein [Vibrio nigripulchritudo]
MSKVSFKLKMIILISLSVLITIVTSYLSVNYYISEYIYESDVQKIEHNTKLLNERIADEMKNVVSLAVSSNMMIDTPQEVKETTMFDKVVKVVSGVIAVGDEGRLEGEERDKYLKMAKAMESKLIDVSQASLIDGQLYSTISVNRDGGSADFYTVNLIIFSDIIRKYAIEGSYVELISSSNQTIFSNKIDGDLQKISSPVEMDGMSWTLNSYVDLQNIRDNTALLNNEITIVLILIGLIVIALSTLTLHQAFRPLLSLKNMVAELSNGTGDLTQRLSVKSKDEIGTISSSINKFIEKLQENFIDVSTSTRSIDEAVEKLSTQSQSNLSTLDGHTQETEQAISAISEMSATADSIADSAVKAAELTDTTNMNANASKRTVQQAVENVNSLINEVGSMSTSISTMSHDTDQINSVLQVIGDIAEQTNLLALNAAIEAARAGEQGRGFAVVADEVRALAARTQESTSQINEMLGKLRGATDNVVSAMESTRSSCEETAQSTNEVMESLNLVTDSVVEINEINSLVATAAKEQSQVTDEVSKNMAAIQEIVHQLNDNASDTLTINRELTATSGSLSDVVGRFKVS